MIDPHWVIVFVAFSVAQALWGGPSNGLAALLPALIAQGMILTRYSDTRRLGSREVARANLVSDELLCVALTALAGLFFQFGFAG